jgi:UDP-glucose 4-epimerase
VIGPLLNDLSIVVVGGSGFIGTHALPRLVAAGARVSAIARHRSARAIVDGVAWIDGDLAAAEPTASWPHPCDAVIYLAQSRAWRTFPDGAADVFRVNVRGPFEAIEYARRSGAKQFIFASSGSVYGQHTAMAREHEPVDLLEARTAYAASKLAAEVLLRPYEAFMRVIVLRLFTPHGAGQPDEMLIPRLVGRVRENMPITVEEPDGLQLNPVAVGDVVEAIVRCLTLNRSATLNVAGPEVLTLGEIGRRIGSLFGLEPVFERKPGPARAVVGDTAALRAALGWTPPTRFPDGLRA